MSPMKHILSALLALALSLPAAAMAQAPRLSDLEQSRALLLSHKVRLEARLADQVRRIGRLKQNSAGVRRDFQLEGALQQNRQLSDKLSKIQQRINGETRALADAYEAQLARKNLGPDQRKALTARLVDIKSMFKGPGSRLVVSGKVTALDSPEDLEEKADLLDDSREKLARQLVRVHKQLSQLKHRKRLQRHGRAVDDTPFDETSTSRTVTVRGTSSTERDGDPNSTSAGPAAPGKQGGTGYNGTPSGKNENPAPAAPKAGLGDAANTTDDASASRNSTSAFQDLSLNEITDAELLRAISGPSSRGKSLEQRIADLEQADSKLSKVLKKIDARSKRLRAQANKIRGAK